MAIEINKITTTTTSIVLDGLVLRFRRPSFLVPNKHHESSKGRECNWNKYQI